ncbi:MAG: helix-turn-helix transcriptional regulator [Candidatus Hinthialibacter antarcticus]|nr:helix-turn-helix transcriptional regulator [Candidatus Hinthialibacter antarcticus]
MKTFGEQLRVFRLRRKMTQQDMADRLGLSSPYIAQMESGFKPPPPPLLVEKLSEILQIQHDERRQFISAAEKERELQSLVKATRKIGYLLAGNKVCVPQKAVSYRVQQEIDELVDAIPRNLTFSLEILQDRSRGFRSGDGPVTLQSHDDLRSWALSQLGDRPNEWLTFLGGLYDVLILTPDERLLCRHPSGNRNELSKRANEAGQFFQKLKEIIDRAKEQSEDQVLPDVIAPHEAWRNIDEALSAPEGEEHETVAPKGRSEDGIRRVPVMSIVEVGSDDFKDQEDLGSIGLPSEWFDRESDYEACLVQSDSYVPLGVWPGCKAVYQLYAPVQNEDLVVVQMGDRRCIRKYFDLGEQILLQGGPLSRPVQVGKNETSVRVIGVVRELISRFREMKP